MSYFAGRAAGACGCAAEPQAARARAREQHFRLVTESQADPAFVQQTFTPTGRTIKLPLAGALWGNGRAALSECVPAGTWRGGGPTSSYLPAADADELAALAVRTVREVFGCSRPEALDIGR